MLNELELYINSIDNFNELPSTTMIDYFSYYLLNIAAKDFVTASDITQCFSTIDLQPYKWTRQYLSEQTGRKYVKLNTGYRLERKTVDKLKEAMNINPRKLIITKQLVELEKLVTNLEEKNFLNEAINCHASESYRASIVLIWILTMYHLENYIYENKLGEFNQALSKNPDKKVRKITKIEDFSDLQDTKIIETARAANIITNDVRKILDEKLGTRNTAAHPSLVKMSSTIAAEFLEDLINNVITKYV